MRLVRVILPYLLVGVALTACDETVGPTAEEKRAFLEMLFDLPTDGEFFTEQAIDKAAPDTGVLLALTAGDIEGYDIYPLLALSRGLADRRPSRDYAVRQFGGIAHPTIKLFWAAVLFDDGSVPPEIVEYLQKALASESQSTTLAEMLGPDFEEFKTRLSSSKD